MENHSQNKMQEILITPLWKVGLLFLSVAGLCAIAFFGSKALLEYLINLKVLDSGSFMINLTNEWTRKNAHHTPQMIIWVLSLSVFLVWLIWCRIVRFHLPKSKKVPWLIMALFLGMALLPTLESLFEENWEDLDKIFYSSIASAAAGFWEEAIFRGILVGFVMRYFVLERKHSLHLYLAIGSLLFGLFHLINLGTDMAILAVIQQIFFTILMGLILAYTYAATGQISLVILMHSANNAFPKFSILPTKAEIEAELLSMQGLITHAISTVLYGFIAYLAYRFYCQTNPQLQQNQ